MAAKMARVWADRLEAGTQVWSDVPSRRRNEVQAILQADVAAGVITEEQYLAILET